MADFTYQKLEEWMLGFTLCRDLLDITIGPHNFCWVFGDWIEIPDEEVKP